MVSMFKGPFSKRKNDYIRKIFGIFRNIRKYSESILYREVQEDLSQQITNKVEIPAIKDNKAEAKFCIPLSDFRCYKDDDNGKTEGLLDMDNVDDDDDDQPSLNGLMI